MTYTGLGRIEVKVKQIFLLFFSGLFLILFLFKVSVFKHAYD